MIKNEQMDDLFSQAKKIAESAYAPYSKFRVGAALLCENGEIVTGVNVENRSYGLAICAERNAVTTMVTMGKRRIMALAIHTPDSADPVGPCGACRQVISEFAEADTPVRFAGSGANQVNTTVGELLPWDSLYDLKK